MHDEKTLSPTSRLQGASTCGFQQLAREGRLRSRDWRSPPSQNLLLLGADFDRCRNFPVEHFLRSLRFQGSVALWPWARLQAANLVRNDIIIFIYLFNWHCITVQALPLGLIVLGEGPARGKKCSTPWQNCSLSKAGQGGWKEISK